MKKDEVQKKQTKQYAQILVKVNARRSGYLTGDQLKIIFGFATVNHSDISYVVDNSSMSQTQIEAHYKASGVLVNSIYQCSKHMKDLGFKETFKTSEVLNNTTI